MVLQNQRKQKENQKHFKSDLNEIVKGNYKLEKQKNCNKKY